MMVKIKNFIIVSLSMMGYQTPNIDRIAREVALFTSGQFGKNHLGDRDEHLPTNHGSDEFYGNLYHLNAEEEPETYYYPKDEEFHKKYGPRGVIHSYSIGKIEDTGPLTRKRMETIDEDFTAAALKFIENANKEGKPFFVWLSATRMHVWTRLKEESVGTTDNGAEKFTWPDGGTTPSAGEKGTTCMAFIIQSSGRSI